MSPLAALRADDYPLRSEENGLPSKSSTVVVEDSAQADGSFLLWHYLCMHLKRDAPVCYVSLQHSYSHLCTIGRKLVRPR